MRLITWLAIVFLGCASDAPNGQYTAAAEGSQFDADVIEADATIGVNLPQPMLTTLTGSTRFDHEVPAEGVDIQLPANTLEPDMEPESSNEPDEASLPEGWTSVPNCVLSYRVLPQEHRVPSDASVRFNHDLERPGSSHEPLPLYTWRWSDVFPHFNGVGRDDVLADLVMPGYSDDWDTFERGVAWGTATRCYELPHGSFLLTEAAAYALWVEMVRETLWYEVNQTAEIRSVVGIRGAVPGSLNWHGNPKNHFNDTIVLLWRDASEQPHVREFPMTADPGTYGFPANESSALYPNRHYPYTNGWHRGYNALQIASYGYRVRDDGNKNGHWDDDRNGWLDGGIADRFRGGSGHNIHMASPSRGLTQQVVHNWSAGCQVIPGMANWMEFIGNAWTGTGDQVDYFLMDVRDVAGSVWTSCAQEEGTHRCPEAVRQLPVVLEGDTRTAVSNAFDQYNCSTANESGGEYVYVLNIRNEGTLSINVESDDPEADPDIHLLSGDDPNACLARAHEGLTYDVSPGRYLVVVDSWVNGDGVVLDGHYRLLISLED